MLSSDDFTWKNVSFRELMDYARSATTIHPPPFDESTGPEMLMPSDKVWLSNGLVLACAHWDGGEFYVGTPKVQGPGTWIHNDHFIYQGDS
jgi:hypothetical protein